MDAKQKRFYDAIGVLVPGSRDANLVRVASYGIAAGLSPEEVKDAIMQNAPGDTRPDPVAVERAVANCYAASKKTTPLSTVYPPKYWNKDSWGCASTFKEAKREEARQSLSEEVRSSVRRYIDASKDATVDDLIFSSPTPVPLDPRKQAAEFINTICIDWRWVSWFGSITQKTGKRGLIAEPGALAYAIEKRLCPKIPSHMTLNPLTGGQGLTKQGKPSFDCAATVAALRFCLVEFDELPLADQIALWTTIVRTKRDEVPVVSVVYSGSKSLHAVVLCRPASFDDIVREEITEADKTRWNDAWDALVRRFASSDNAAERMDLAPMKNPAIHTRVPGAMREETGKRQTLLYLDTQLAKDALELF